MRQKKHSFMTISNIAATYIGTVIGAGFASGQEILVFFTRYGIVSYIGLLFVSFLFMYIGSKILILGNQLKASSYADMVEQVFGKVSPFINIYLFIAYMVISIAMFAGAGLLFGHHREIGVVITAVLAAIAVIRGIDGLLYANTVLIPLIFIFHIIMFAYHIYLPNRTVSSMDLSVPLLLSSIKSGSTYASYNIILCIGVLAPLGNSIRDKSVAKWGGYMGGALIGIMLIMTNYCLLTYIPDIHMDEMPLLSVAKLIHPLIGNIYLFVLWGAMFTTLIANLFSIISIIESKLPSYLHDIAFIFAVVVFVLLSRLGFSNIVSFLYPILGVMGLVFLLYIAIYPTNSSH